MRIVHGHGAQTSPPINLTVGEIDLLAEALKMAGSRHLSQARFNPSSAGPHDRKALAMASLRLRLLRLGKEAT